MSNATLDSIIGTGFLEEINNNGRISIHGKFTTSDCVKLLILSQEKSQALYCGKVIKNGVSTYINITVHLGNASGSLQERSIELHA
jgi:hypothetical protein